MFVYRFIRVLQLIVLFAVVLSCEKENIHNGRVPLAGVDGIYLYKDEVDLMYATYGSETDSAEFVNNYVEKWLVEVLFYDKAMANVPYTSEIEGMVESYRKSLILNIYQDGLINQHLQNSITETDIETFYHSNEPLFELEETMVKGLMLKVPEKAPRKHLVRTWCMRRNQEDMEELEKYSISHDAQYEYFMDEWQVLSDVAKLVPLTEDQLAERLSRKSTIEFNDGGFIYFVCADTIIGKGGRKPIEMVSGEIKELLTNSRKANFIKERKKSIYKEALEKGLVELFENKKTVAIQ